MTQIAGAQMGGKVAIVTGGASGIGAACARLLAREGAKVVITDSDATGGTALAGEITRETAGAGGAATFLAQDVSDEARWPEVIASTERLYGRLDVMVANAGIGLLVAAIDMTLADWRRQNAVNMDGVFLAVKHAVPAMRRAGGGSIVIMSSVAGIRGSAGLAGYCASKGGVRLFAKAVALECAIANDGIRVNTVHPGIIDTPIWQKIPTGAEGAARNAAIDPHALAREVPVGVPGTADEVAAGVLFLASDASRYMTGSELVIDGGITAGTARRW